MLRWSRKVVRATAWLAFLLLAGLAIFLFTSTAGPVPNHVHPWAEFGCQGSAVESIYSYSLPLFACLSRDGRYYATAKSARISEAGPSWDVQVHRCSDHSLLLHPKEYHDLPYAISVSSDEKMVALDKWPLAQRLSSLFETATGNTIVAAHENMAKLRFSENGQQVCYLSDGDACYGPVDNLAARVRVTSGPNERATVVFFDLMGSPQALFLRNRTQSESMELRDLQTNKCQWRIDNIGDYLDPMRAPPPQIACVRLVGDEENIAFFSLENGEKLGTTSFNSDSFADECILPYHSPDGRYIIFPAIHPPVFSTLLTPGKHPWIEEKISALEAAFPAFAESISLDHGRSPGRIAVGQAPLNSGAVRPRPSSPNSLFPP